MVASSSTTSSKVRLMDFSFYKKYTLWLVSAIAGYLVLAAGINTSVDPWRIISSPWANQSLDPWRDSSEVVRTGKVALANRGDWEIAAIGSSRIEVSIDPSHPAFRDKRAVNLAMAAANIYETTALAHYTLDRNPDLKTLIFGIEAGDLHNPFDSRLLTDYYQSPLYENSPTIELTVNQIFGASALSDSIATILRAIKKIQPERNALGLWTSPRNPGNIRKYMEGLFTKGFINSTDEWEVAPADFKLEKTTLLEALIERCQREDIQLYIVIPPQHGLKLLHPTENTPSSLPWEIDLQKLIDICRAANTRSPEAIQIQLWNFSNFSPWTTEPLPTDDEGIQRMKNWFDFGHAKVPVGNEVVNTLFLGKTSTGIPFGTPLLDVPWEAYKTQWIEAHQRYVETHTADVQWWRSWVALQSTGISLAP